MRAAGGEVVTGCAVEARRRRAPAGIRAPPRARASSRARFAVFCAGAWSDRLAVAAGGDPDPRIVPFRGAWLRLRPERRDLVRALVYPVPDPALPFLGVHFTRGTDDEVLVGPTALLAGARDAYALRRLMRRDLRDTLALARHLPDGPPLVAHRACSELRHAASRRALVRRRRPLHPRAHAATTSSPAPPACAPRRSAATAA